MRYLRRYCLLLCALVMCVGLFSTTAHADTESRYKLFVQTDASSVGINSSHSYYDGDNYYTYASSPGFTIYTSTSYWWNKFAFTLTDETDYILFEAGKNYDLRIENLFFDISISFEDGTVWYDDVSLYGMQSLYIHYTDGTKEAENLTLAPYII